MMNDGFNQKCRVLVPRIADLDAMVFSKPPDIPILRHKSMPNLGEIDTSSTQMNQTIDMAKIRSILKNPKGKPRSVINRRVSTNARVTFQVADDIDDTPLIDFGPNDSQNAVNEVEPSTNQNTAKINDTNSVNSSSNILDSVHSAQNANLDVLVPLKISRRALPSLIPISSGSSAQYQASPQAPNRE